MNNKIKIHCSNCNTFLFDGYYQEGQLCSACQKKQWCSNRPSGHMWKGDVCIFCGETRKGNVM